MRYKINTYIIVQIHLSSVMKQDAMQCHAMQCSLIPPLFRPNASNDIIFISHYNHQRDLPLKSSVVSEVEWRFSCLAFSLLFLILLRPPSTGLLPVAVTFPLAVAVTFPLLISLNSRTTSWKPSSNVFMRANIKRPIIISVSSASAPRLLTMPVAIAICVAKELGTAPARWFALLIPSPMSEKKSISRLLLL